MKKKKFLKAVIIVCILLITAFVLLFSFRNSVLQYVIEKYQTKFRESYRTSLSIRNSQFISLNTIQVQNLVLVPLGRDTLVTVHSVVTSVDLLHILFGKIKLNKLEVEDVHLTLVKKDTIDNYSFLFRKNPGPLSKTSAKTISYAETFNKLINSFFDKIPKAISINAIRLSVNRNDQHFQLEIPAFRVHEEKITARVIDSSTDKKKVWGIEGTIDASNEKLNVVVYSENVTGVEIPFLYTRYGLNASCDTLRLTLNQKEFGRGELRLEGQAKVTNLFVRHAKLSPSYVIIKKAGINYNIQVGANSLMLDSSSVITINKVSFQPFVRYVKNSPQEKEITLNIKSPKMVSQDFFESLPLGICENLFGIQTEGYLTYLLNFTINTLNPDSLHFESSLRKEDFKILKYGSAYIPKINASFSHTPYERGGPLRTFVVGPENPDFTPYDEISDYLKYALLTSEDGNFFYHKGFNEEAFAKSIATNFKKGAFVRGGSTISMQLVKNVFLTRNKTISRKLEEALIVWLIENNNLSTKQRMYEVYLNIIEWGPNIYGIKEASEFYFAKKPSELSLSESIFLTSIVPRPKFFKYSFDEAGNLRGFLAGYYKLVANRLMRKEIITEEEFDNLQPNVVLYGPARLLVTPSDSIPDFIQDEEEEIEEEEGGKQGIKGVFQFFKLDKLFKKKDKSEK